MPSIFSRTIIVSLSVVLLASLDDKVTNHKNDTHRIIFGRGFGGITDMKVGPDGYLYVLSVYSAVITAGLFTSLETYAYLIRAFNGAIFRIL